MIHVITDSSSDLPDDLAARSGIDIVPLTIRFGEDEFVDRRDLTTGAFWEKLVDSRFLPETAAPSAGAFEERFRIAHAAGATGIVVLTISAQLSGTYQSAVIAAERFGDRIPIRVIDSQSVGMGLGLPVLSAAQAASGDSTMQEVVDAALEAIRSTHVVAALDTLEFLHRGGRIGGAQAFFGNILSIKPLITLDGGVVAPLGRVRTRSKAIAALEQRLAALGPSIKAAALFHADAPDAEAVVSRLQPYVSDALITTLLGAVVGTHTGPGTVGIAYVTG